VLLLIDNYDSFTFNLVQAFGALGAKATVVRHDAAALEELEAMRPRRLVVSPGPKTPREAGVSVAAIRRFAGRVPILGVCLGHQCIAEAFGGRVVKARRLRHGKTSPVEHDGAGVFRGLPSPFDAMRYHSLVVDEASLPAELAPTARARDDGELMGLRHRTLPIEGVQFHPESYRTERGARMLENFLAYEPPASSNSGRIP
jgi:anthranilate synthase/aminodeoxychorismate synthase-like glutamine amidotransferase